MADAEALHPLRPILRNWVWEHGHVGTRYLDCADGQVKFDDGKKARSPREDLLRLPEEGRRRCGACRRRARDQGKRAGAVPARAQLAIRRKPVGRGRATRSAGLRDLGLVCATSRLHSAPRALCPGAMFDTRSAPRSSATSGARTWACASSWPCTTTTVFCGLPARCSSASRPSSTGACVPGRRSRSSRCRLGLLPVVGTPSARRAGSARCSGSPRFDGAVQGPQPHIVESARLWVVATTEDQLVAVQERFAQRRRTSPGDRDLTGVGSRIVNRVASTEA